MDKCFVKSPWLGASQMNLWHMLRYFTRRTAFAQRARWGWSLLAAFIPLVAPVGHAQNLNWEGQTGAFVTPFAYTSVSPAKGLELPAVSFHYLDAGNVLGGFYDFSVTVAFINSVQLCHPHPWNSEG